MDSPLIFRKWAGISVLASVMERKIWTETRRGILYPNLYVILVGVPGVGKSVVVGTCEKMLRALEEIKICPHSVTAAALVDALAEAERKIVHPYYFKFNSLQVVSSELQNFFPSYETELTGMLTKFYDCEFYEHLRRTGKLHIKIEAPQLSILGGTTPAYLNGLFPEGAWSQGFTSRTIFIYADRNENHNSIFGTSEDDEYFKQLFEDHVHDLKEIMHLVGKVQWNDAAMKATDAWMRAGEKPVPEHGRLASYNTRRTTMLLKLSLIASISRNSSMEVIEEDFDTAKGWLFEAERLIPEIFKSMATTAESRIMEDAHYYMSDLYRKMNRPVPEHHLYAFLKNRTASQNIKKVIETMERSRMIKGEYSAKDAATCYTPL